MIIKSIFHKFCFVILSALIFTGCVQSDFYPWTISGTITVLTSGEPLIYTLKTVHGNTPHDWVIEINDAKKGQVTVRNKTLYKASEDKLQGLFNANGFTSGIEDLVTDIVNDRYAGLYKCSLKTNSSTINNYDVSWGTAELSDKPSEFMADFECRSTNDLLFISIDILLEGEVHYIL